MMDQSKQEVVALPGPEGNADAATLASGLALPRLYVCDMCEARQPDQHRCTECGFSRRDEEPMPEDFR